MTSSTLNSRRITVECSVGIAEMTTAVVGTVTATVARLSRPTCKSIETFALRILTLRICRCIYRYFSRYRCTHTTYVADSEAQTLNLTPPNFVKTHTLNLSPSTLKLPNVNALGFWSPKRAQLLVEPCRLRFHQEVT